MPREPPPSDHDLNTHTTKHHHFPPINPPYRHSHAANASRPIQTRDPLPCDLNLNTTHSTSNYPSVSSESRLHATITSTHTRTSLKPLPITPPLRKSRIHSAITPTHTRTSLKPLTVTPPRRQSRSLPVLLLLAGVSEKRDGEREVLPNTPYSPHLAADTRWVGPILKPRCHGTHELTPASPCLRPRQGNIAHWEGFVMATEGSREDGKCSNEHNARDSKVHAEVGGAVKVDCGVRRMGEFEDARILSYLRPRSE